MADACAFPDGGPYLYADNAATTPLAPDALEAMLPYLGEKFGNPSGIHRVAREAARALAAAREKVARLLGAEARELYFTSGGSESDNWVLRGAARRFADLYGNAAPVRIVTSSIEHHAVLRSCEQLEAEGVEVTYLPVDAQGHVSPRDLEAALAAQEEANRAAGVDAPGCALVSVMLANNEIGTIEDVPALASVAHAHGAPFHTDAVQAVGHIPVNVDDLGVDALSLSAHKFHGPRGCGALYLREGFSVPALIAGGAQERGERAGTENLAGIVGTAAALELMCDRLDEKRARVARLRDQVVAAVTSAVPNVHLTGDPLRRLPSIASFTCENVDGELLVVILDQLGVAAATGSACSTGSTDPSHVLTACGIPGSEAKGALRISIADDLTENDVWSYSFKTRDGIVYHAYFIDFSNYHPAFSDVRGLCFYGRLYAVCFYLSS